MRALRGLFGLILTGLVVEIALIPFALYHFHRAGLYGVAANIVAIPLTTFVIMPLEGGALLLDLAGWGAPLWSATGWTTDALLRLAYMVGSAEGAVAMLPTMPRWAFALMVGGGLWPVSLGQPNSHLGYGSVRLGRSRRGLGAGTEPARHR
jgi:competence protein ComEC